VDLVFADDKKVRTTKEEFISLIRNSGIPTEDKLNKFNQLVTEMAESSGYKSKISFLDSSRVIFPNIEQPAVDPDLEKLKAIILKIFAKLEEAVDKDPEAVKRFFEENEISSTPQKDKE